MATTAHVTPEVLRWARESMGYALDQAAARLRLKPEALEAAEVGEGFLTLRQAERAASLYDRPFGELFLPAPPIEEPQEALLRRLPGAPAPPWPPEMLSLARRVRHRQEAASELYGMLDEAPPWSEALEQLRVADLDAMARSARLTLGIDFEEQSSWRDGSGYAPLRAWIGSVEALGVLVMQDGTLPIELVRGFVSAHASVPVIVVNTQDDPRARAFTILHEFGHLVLIANGEPVGPSTETWCNTFAGEVLMPHDLVAKALERTSRVHDALARVDDLALTFGVSSYAAAVRVAQSGLLPKDEMRRVIGVIQSRGGAAKSSGGNYYGTKVTRLGPTFIRLVFDGLDGQALTLSNAAGLLDVKVNHFDKLRETVASRVEFE